jgi:selenide, water dikinase
VLEAARVPLIPGALELATRGCLTSGDKTNRRYVGDDVQLSDALNPALINLLFDPQTAGGLLISIAAEHADALCARLNERYPDAAIIGRVQTRGTHALVVR